MKRFLLSAAIVATPAVATAQFEYNPPGMLVSGSGQGRADDTVYVPDMRFPIEVAPAYPNSQVWGRGGSQGPGGGQCDAANYSYPWWDNYCESRSYTMPLCPSGQGHQGQDIRPSTCDDDTHWAVAAEDGQITNIGSYSVYLVSDGGTQHRYLHLDVPSLRVNEGQRVSKGDRIGRVSNTFFDSNGNSVPTTIHLHYDLNQNISGMGNVYVPPYMSLVRSYETLLGVEAEPCQVIPAQGGIVDDGGPCAFFFGPSQFWRVVDGMGEGGQMHWTNAWTNDTPSNYARWSLHFAEAGKYNVEVNIVPPYNVSKRSRYMVRANGQESTQELDQSAVEGWVSLGEFDFAEGGEQRVEVYDNTGEDGDDLHITADAVRLTRVDGVVDPPDMGGGPDDPDMGGGPGNPDMGGGGPTQRDAGEDPGFSADGGIDPDDIRVNRGCCAVVDGSSDATPLLLLAVVGGLARVRRRRR